MVFSLLLHFLQIQRSLAAPAASKSEHEVQLKAAQPAPALLRALTRVLSATDSKENEAEREHPNTGSEEYAHDNRPAGKAESLHTSTKPYWEVDLNTKDVIF